MLEPGRPGGRESDFASEAALDFPPGAFVAVGYGVLDLVDPESVGVGVAMEIGIGGAFGGGPDGFGNPLGKDEGVLELPVLTGDRLVVPVDTGCLGYQVLGGRGGGGC